LTAGIPAPIVPGLDKSSFRLGDRVVFAILFTLVVALYWPVATILPLHGDNFYVLAWANAMPLTAVAAVDPAIYPEWRPLAYLSVWLEHRLVGIDGVAVHYATNLAIWAVCALLVYRITFALSGSRAAAFCAALILIVDQRIESALTWIIGRQMLLACLFGLGAIYILLVRGRDRDLRRPEWIAIGALLLASALSKEYGLSFAIAIAAHGLWSRHRMQVAASTIAVVCYGALRIGLAAGAIGGPYCESMGLMFATDDRCVEPATATGIGQMAYNAAASFVGTLMPGLFSDNGAIEIAGDRVARTTIFLALVAIGYLRGSPQLIPLALLPLATGMMGFMSYRPRNQLTGLVGLAILGGVGLATILRPRFSSSRSRVVATVAVIAVLVVLVARGYDARANVRRAVIDARLQPPCDAGWLARDYSRSFARLLKAAYQIPDPHCVDTN
jgi:hypothetical protein